MTFMQIEGLGDAKEPELLPETKTNLVVEDVHTYESEKNGRTITRIRHNVEDERYEDANAIMHWMSHPMEDDEPETARLLVLQMKRYLIMTGVPFEATGFNEEDLYGASFEADVIIDENEDSGEQFNKLVLPRLPEEHGGKAKAK